MARTAWLIRSGRADGGRRRRYQRWAGVLAAVVATGLPLLAATTAEASGGAGEFVSLTNSARSGHGVSRLAVSGDLASIAQRQAQRMADKGELYHNPKLASEVHGWQKIGENVGYGPDAAAIHNAFMHSSGHRANILDGAYTQIGVGVVVKHGVVWVSEVFRQPEGAVAAKPHHPPQAHAEPDPVAEAPRDPRQQPDQARDAQGGPLVERSAQSSREPVAHGFRPFAVAAAVKHSASPSHSSPAPTPTVAAVPVVTSSGSPSTPLTVDPHRLLPVRSTAAHRPTPAADHRRGPRWDAGHPRGARAGAQPAGALALTASAARRRSA